MSKRKHVTYTAITKANGQAHKDLGLTKENKVPHSCPGIEDLKKELQLTRELLYFYANPYTYFAIAFFPDPPCGDFMQDFGKVAPHWDDFGQLADTLKPGKRARKFLERNPKVLVQLREMENKHGESTKLGSS